MPTQPQKSESGIQEELGSEQRFASDVSDQPTGLAGGFDALFLESTQGTNHPSSASGFQFEPVLPASGLSRFRIDVLLGQGGMGKVYRAFDSVLGRDVALKFLGPHVQDHAEQILAEARSQARVDHPSVVKVFEVGSANSQPYIALQLVHGQSLSEMARQLNLEEKVEVIRQACEGLHAAHRMGLLHRDVKPGNVLVERHPDDGLRAYVTDFGLALDTTTSRPDGVPRVIGTPAYMSPEQVAGRPADRRSDVYSAGAMLYTALCGMPPFRGETIRATLSKVEEGKLEPPRNHCPSLPADLEAVVLKAMSRDPGDRYPSAWALADDLRRWLDGKAVVALHRDRLYRMQRWVKKNRALTAVGVVSILLVMGFGAWGIRSAMWARAQARLSQRFGQQAELMEARTAFAETLPLHDTEREKAQVRNLMAEIRSQIKPGAPAEAPALYALGRGHMALGEWAAARAYLERVWALGLQTPETAYALGRTLASLYGLELRGLAGELRRERQAELDRTLKPQILSLLAQAPPISGEGSSLAKAMLAREENRYEDAMALAEKILETQPWRYPAALLRAEICMDRSQMLIDRDTGDDLLQARNLLDKAAEEVLQAAQITRSAAPIFETLAQIRYAQLIFSLNAGSPDPEALKAVEDAVSLALAADSRSWVAWETRSIALYRWAERGAEGDPRPWLDRSVEAAEHAVALNPEAMRALNSKGNALWGRGRWMVKQGEDPRPVLESAIATFQQALLHRRFEHMIQGNLGSCYVVRGEWELNHGLDPRCSLQEALKHFEQALAINKLSVVSLANSSIAELYLARAAEGRGEDPRSLYAKSLDFRIRALAAGGRISDPIGSLNQADIHLRTAAWCLDHGVDPGVSLIKGREMADAAADQMPGSPEALDASAFARILQARQMGPSAKSRKLMQEARQQLTVAIQKRPGEERYRQHWKQILG